MKDVQSTAGGANSAHQNINFLTLLNFFEGHLALMDPIPNKKLVISSLVDRSSTSIYSCEHLPQFTGKIAELDEPRKH
jgi:hypothetical protein